MIAVICWFLGFMATTLLAQQRPGEFPKELVGAGAKLVVTSVSGLATAIHVDAMGLTIPESQGDGQKAR
jgi:hypothetical protein